MHRESRTNRPLRASWIMASVCIMILTAITVGCAGINHLREAQDAFNQASSAENAVRFDAKPGDTSASLANIRGGYASALVSLNKMEAGEVKALQQDGLWETALTLKALCQWKLGKFTDAIDTARQVQATAGNQMFPRDRALLTALPGLIKTDQAYAMIMATGSLNDIEALLVDRDKGAVADIERARTVTDRDHPVQVYLIQGQLAAYRNYTVALYQLNNQAVVPGDSPVRAAAVEQLKELNRLLNLQQPVSGSQALVLYWAKLCGFSPP